MLNQAKNLKPKDIIKMNGKVGYAVKQSENTYGFWTGKGTYSPENLPVIDTERLESVSNDEKIALLSNIFVWGEILEVHVVKNDYEFVIFEYKNNRGEIHFHTFLNFKDMGRGYLSFDTALLGLLESKYQGSDSRAAVYCERLLEMPTIV